HLDRDRLSRVQPITAAAAGPASGRGCRAGRRAIASGYRKIVARTPPAGQAQTRVGGLSAIRTPGTVGLVTGTGVSFKDRPGWARPLGLCAHSSHGDLI